MIPSIKNFTSLQEIILDNNKLTDLPEDIGKYLSWNEKHKKNTHTHKKKKNELESLLHLQKMSAKANPFSTLFPSSLIRLIKESNLKSIEYFLFFSMAIFMTNRAIKIKYNEIASLTVI